MSYIINSTSPFISVKLTDIGRQKLASGRLNFSFWSVGDSEINYNREELFNNNFSDTVILKPVDKQPNLKYFVKPNNTNNPLNQINESNLNVIQAIVNNKAEERGFFDNLISGFTTNISESICKKTGFIKNSELSGTSFLNINTSGITEGDLFLIKLTNDIAGNQIPNSNNTPLPYLWFKIKDLTSNQIEVDRNLPNYSADTSISQYFIYPSGEVYNTIGSGSTTAYWDSGTLSFSPFTDVNCNEVPVWNMNNVWSENLAGITGLTTSNLYEDYTKFGSFNFLGQKENYFFNLNTETNQINNNSCNIDSFSVLDNINKSISIIHYTNNTISNLYGETFYIDPNTNKLLKLHLPTIMYHRKFDSSSLGMTFISFGEVKKVNGTDIEYYDLIEDPTLINNNLTPLVIGKIFPQYKMVIITDDEIVASLSYKSNRNWTLPELSAALFSPSGNTSTGVLGVNETIYLTYILETNSGLKTALPCQKYIKITNNTSSPKDVNFKINNLGLLNYMKKIEELSYDGSGFYGHKFKLSYQVVDEPTTRPNPGNWKILDFTSNEMTENSNETINPILLERQNPLQNNFSLNLINDLNSETFNLINILNLPLNSSPSDLQFGDERFFYGNLDTYIGATIFKTLFNISINANQFNSTTNPTRVNTLNPPLIRISEMGIYDSDNNLVCIGKFSTPIPLEGNDTIMLEASIDF